MLSNAEIELAELAGAFIHELKNHISTLNLNLQNLAEEFEHPANTRERRVLDRIQRLQAECGRMIEVSNDFNRFARLQNLALQPVQLDGVLEQVVDFINPSARANNIQIHSYIATDAPMVALDAEVFKQALLNLLLNAMQAMPAGGEITLQMVVEGGWLVLRIIDNGQGMSPEIASRIFKPYYTTKPGGSGLGLATTRKIIEAHKGTISVDSEPMRGTCFTIRLPIYEPGQEAVQQPTEDPIHVRKRTP